MSDGKAEDAALAAERAMSDDRVDGPGGDPTAGFLTQEEIDRIIAEGQDDDDV